MQFHEKKLLYLSIFYLLHPNEYRAIFLVSITKRVHIRYVPFYYVSLSFFQTVFFVSINGIFSDVQVLSSLLHSPGLSL